MYYYFRIQCLKRILIDSLFLNRETVDSFKILINKHIYVKMTLNFACYFVLVVNN